MSGAKLQKVIARTERAAFEAGYKVVGSSVLSDGTVHVDLVRRRQSRLTRRIYFVQMEHAQHIKIGIANNSGRRLRALQTANPEPLHILGTLAGEAEDERELHRVLSAYRLSGEWFANGPWVEAVRYCLKWNRSAGALLLKLKAQNG